MRYATMKPTDIGDIWRESSAAENPYPITTARTDTLAEYMRHNIIVDPRATIVSSEDIDFSRIEPAC